MQDLFESQIEVAAEKRALQLLDDPKYLQNQLAKVAAELQEEKEYRAIAEPKVKRYDGWLDSTGHFGCDRVAEKLRVPYVTPGGKVSTMGEKKFCQALAHLKVIINEGDGYRLSKPWYPYGKEVPMTDARGVNHWSVKFSPEGVDKLADLFESKDYTWESTGISGVIAHE